MLNLLFINGILIFLLFNKSYFSIFFNYFGHKNYFKGFLGDLFWFNFSEICHKIKLWSNITGKKNVKNHFDSIIQRRKNQIRSQYPEGNPPFLGSLTATSFPSDS